MIMPFGEAEISLSYYNRIYNIVKRYLSSLGIIVQRADEQQLAEDLWENVVTHIRKCDMGIAIIDDKYKSLISPNIFIEIGYMFGLNKKVLLLREKSTPPLPSDLAGRLYYHYDQEKIDEDIPEHLDRWIRFLNIIPPRVAELADQIRNRITEININPAKHTLVMNFAHKDEIFIRFVEYISNIYRKRNSKQYIQAIFKAHRPQIIVELLLKDNLGLRKFKLPPGGGTLYTE